MKEDDIVELIKKRLVIKSKDVIVGPGDDTAILSFDKAHYLLMTTDALVEGIHFTRKEATLKEIGRKAIAVNLSDIAAMGGIPLYALVSAGFPTDFPKESIIGLIDGMQKISAEYGCDIVGGNLSKSPVLFIDVSMVGKVEKKYFKLRSTAGVGDAIFVTGRLGGTRVRKHLNILPRIRESRLIIRSFDVTAMMDISDGLSSDLTRLTRSGERGFRIYLDKIPISQEAVNISSSSNEAVMHALNDGEDYELLFTVPSKDKKKVPELIDGLLLSYIGEITAEQEYVGITKDGKTIKILPSGYSHF